LTYTNHIKSGCIEIYFNPETKEPESCLIRVNNSLLLTPSLLSTQALIVILKRILEGIESHKSRQDILADDQINNVLRRARQEEAFEWKHIDAIRSESGEWKIWLNTGAISLYLSLEEVRSILNDFENLGENLSFPLPAIKPEDKNPFLV
jgi:hypothetical protein